MSVRVVDPGFNVTVQDLGRPSFQHLGVPVSGAVSPAALKIGNCGCKSLFLNRGTELGPLFNGI